MITVNLDKAKAITKTRLREERYPLLVEQDILYMKAQENNADTVDIIKEKQRLRDITNSVDSAKTTDELKAIKIKHD